MIRQFFLRAAFAVALLATSLPAHAALTSVNPTSPDGPTTDLTDVMTTLYGAGNFARVDDSGDQVWAFLSSSATLDAQVKYAANISSFGAFQDPTDPATAGNFTRIADITGSGFAAVFSNPSAYGEISGGVLTINGPTGDGTPTNLTSPLAFGFHNTNTGNYWSSNQSANTDPGSNPGGFGNVNPTDHMVTFFVTNSSGTVAGFTGYVIAYEDRSHAQGSDRDFNDAVIQINGGIAPVPEPSTLAIAGLGGLGLIGYGIRRRRSA